MNRLSQSKSPYLQQHAHNPVDWYPWGKEALAKANAEDKPILVSIGYSACHWCHVMEKESFEDQTTADLMNAAFVCIKIDREERPDLDNIYMDAVQAMGLQGGWPLNVFLMPNQKPFYGGTYFPNKQWKGLLANIADAYHSHRGQLAASAESFGESIGRSEIDKYGLTAEETVLDKSDIDLVLGKLADQFDLEWGGMKRKPKFPMPTIWSFVLDAALLGKDQELLDKVFFTLKKIGMGGIYDHIRGGWARYSVDGEWFAPHFEKMLYDNGQLIELYAKAFQVCKDPFFEEKVLETIEWLEAEMLQDEGGFFSAQDADSEGEEGKFYTWTFGQLESLLGEEMNWFGELYTVKSQGNWEDGANILFQTDSYRNLALAQGLSEEAFKERLAKAKEKLLEARNKRVFPGLDDKILSGWNGLMVAGLVQAYLATGSEKALLLAKSNADFVWDKMFQDGVLYRSYKGGQAYTPGFLEDYAAMIRGYISLYQGTFESIWLARAKSLTDLVLAQFYDSADGFFFFNNPNAERLIANKKELFDNVIPASNSTMARNLQDLGLYFYENEYTAISEHMLGRMKKLILSEPAFLCNWAQLLLHTVLAKAEVAIVGKGAIDKAKELQKSYVANMVLAATENDAQNIPLLDLKTPDSDGNALIYVCFDRACQRPVTEVAEALAQFPSLA